LRFLASAFATVFETLILLIFTPEEDGC